MANNKKSETPKTPRLVRNNKGTGTTAAPVRSEVETPRPPQPASDPDSFERLNEMIRMRAFELYEQRGRADGFEAQDWLQAEEEVMEQYRKRTA